MILGRKIPISWEPIQKKIPYCKRRGVGTVRLFIDRGLTPCRYRYS
jgi:hypothetical protein